MPPSANVITSIPADWPELELGFDPAHLPSLPMITDPVFRRRFLQGSSDELKYLALHGDALLYVVALRGASIIMTAECSTRFNRHTMRSYQAHLRSKLCTNNLLAYLALSYKLPRYHRPSLHNVGWRAHATLWEAYIGAVYLSERETRLQELYEWFDSFYNHEAWSKVYRRSPHRSGYPVLSRSPILRVSAYVLDAVFDPDFREEDWVDDEEDDEWNV